MFWNEKQQWNQENVIKYVRIKWLISYIWLLWIGDRMNQIENEQNIVAEYK